MFIPAPSPRPHFFAFDAEMVDIGTPSGTQLAASPKMAPIIKGKPKKLKILILITKHGKRSNPKS